MMHKARSSIEKMPYYFSRSTVEFQGNMAEKKSIFARIGRFRLQLQLQFTDGYEMMHKAWRNIEGMP